MAATTSANVCNQLVRGLRQGVDVSFLIEKYIAYLKGNHANMIAIITTKLTRFFES
jgi:hypothetical protein